MLSVSRPYRRGTSGPLIKSHIYLVIFGFMNILGLMSMSGCLRTSDDLSSASSPLPLSSSSLSLRSEWSEATIPTDQSLSLTVSYTQGSTPVVERRVVFKLLSSLDDDQPTSNVMNLATAGHLLVNTEAITDIDGTCEVMFLSGSSPASLYVQALDPDHPEVTPVSWSIDVGSDHVDTQLVSENTQVRLQVGERFDLRVRYIHTDENNLEAFHSDRILNVQLDSTTSSPETIKSSVSPMSIITDDRGEAVITVIAGDISESFDVHVYDPVDRSIAPLTWAISVVRADTTSPHESKIRVTINDELPPDLTSDVEISAQVSLYQGLTCEELTLMVHQLPEPERRLPLIEPYNDMNRVIDSAVNLDESSVVFSVTALLYDEIDTPLGFGCADQVYLSADTTRDVSLRVKEVALRFESTHQVVHRFNLISSLETRGRLDLLKSALKLIRIFARSGEEMPSDELQRLCNELELYTQCRSLENLISYLDFINLADFIPAQSLYAMTLTGHLLEVLRDLRIVGELGVEQDDEEASNAIQSRWVSLMFGWDDVCISPRACQEEIDFNQLHTYSHVVAYPLEITENTRARVKFSAQLNEFNYENIALGILESVLIPTALDVPRPSSLPLDLFLQDFFVEICDGRYLPSSFSSSELCLETLADQLSRLIYRELSILHLSEPVNVIGAFTPDDSDQDLVIDDLHLGRWDVEHNLSNFIGCFETCVDDTCEQTTCQFNAD